jgi:hypothetical protein
LADNNELKYFCNEEGMTKEEFEKMLASIPTDRIKFKVSIQ